MTSKLTVDSLLAKSSILTLIPAFMLAAAPLQFAEAHDDYAAHRLCQALPPQPEAFVDGGSAATAEEPPPVPQIDPSTLSVKPGPLETERKSLLAHIKQAESQGIGTKGYLTAFDFMEGVVSSGASEDAIRSRLTSIAVGLKDQLSRAEYLKTARPVPTAGSGGMEGGDFGGMGGSGLGGLGGLGGLSSGGSGGTPDLSGLNLPDGMKLPNGMKLPPGLKLPNGMSQDSLKQQMKDPETRARLKEQIKNNPDAQNLIKQFLGK